MEDTQHNNCLPVPLLSPRMSSSKTSASTLFLGLKPTEVVNEVRQMYKIAFPLMISSLLTYGKSGISMWFMGQVGKDALAGGSLAIGFANITGYSVLSGLAMGMDAITSQAYGAKQWSLIGLTLQRTILILLLCCLPISLVWLYVEPILLLLGQDPSISLIASTYLSYSLPDLVFISIICPFKIYLRSHKLTYPIMLSAAVALSLHFPINYFLINHFELGIKGVALASAVMDLNILIVMALYVFIYGTKHNKETWQGWSMECFKGWDTILSLAIPNCVSVCLEWWWYELMIIISGLLPNATDAVASMGILIQATSLIYIFPSSLSLAVSTRVGHELGGAQPNKAKSASTISLCCSIFTSILALSFSFTSRNVWGRVFTSDEAVIALTAAAMPILGICELGNCPQTTICGVLRGSARPKLGANINLASFYGVGLPVALAMSFFMKMGLLGLWIGLLAAQMACAILMVIVLIRTNWDEEAQRAKGLIGTTAPTFQTYNGDCENKKLLSIKVVRDEDIDIEAQKKVVEAQVQIKENEYDKIPLMSNVSN